MDNQAQSSSSSDETMASTTTTTTLTSWFDYLSLEDFLGFGSFGFVFKAATGNETQSLSAVKVIFIEVSGKSLEEQENDMHRITREYKLMAGKSHENILRILKSTNTPFTLSDLAGIKNFPCLRENGEALDFIDFQCVRVNRLGSIPAFCIQMELCGKTLRQWLNSQSIDNPELHRVQVAIVQDMIEGLSYLHSNSIMHRDFRPENIMFTYSEIEEFALPIKIGDFGLCRRIHSEQTLTKTLTPGVGNDSYRAPEAKGMEYGVQADLYSLGLVIWEVLQLIKYKERDTQFLKLVNESKTNVVKQHQSYLNAKEMIIMLTKRRIQDRIKNIEEVWFAPATACTVMVKSRQQLLLHLKFCVEGDTFEINPEFYEGELELRHNNVTLRGTGDSELSIGRGHLKVLGGSCTVTNLRVHMLEIVGNHNVIHNVHCSIIVIRGSGNNLSEMTVNQFGYESVIQGTGNVLENCTINSNRNRIYVEGYANKLLSITFDIFDNSVESSKTVSVLAFITPLNLEDEMNSQLVLRPNSSYCFIKNCSLVSALIFGSFHVLEDTKFEKMLTICGSKHSLKNCSAPRLYNTANDSTIDNCHFGDEIHM